MSAKTHLRVCELGEAGASVPAAGEGAVAVDDTCIRVAAPRHRTAVVAGAGGHGGDEEHVVAVELVHVVHGVAGVKDGGGEEWERADGSDDEQREQDEDAGNCAVREHGGKPADVGDVEQRSDDDVQSEEARRQCPAVRQ